MKKACALIVVITLIITLSSCVAFEDKVLKSLGKYKNHEFYTQGAFQDYTDYAKYYFAAVDFTDNGYFTKIQPSAIDSLNEHLDDFESLIETYRENDPTREIVVNYDFDRSLIDDEDYLFIYSEQYDPCNDGNMVLANYDIYFFDIQTNTLYYFHNNI